MNKEKIQKLATIQKEAVDLMKSGDMDGAIAKQEEIQKMTQDLADAEPETTQNTTDSGDSDGGDAGTGAEVTKTLDEIKKTFDDSKASLEEIKKWASMNISADSIKTLMEDFNALKDQVTKMADRVEKVENAKGTSQQTQEVTKTSEGGVWGNLGLF